MFTQQNARHIISTCNTYPTVVQAKMWSIRSVFRVVFFSPPLYIIGNALGIPESFCQGHPSNYVGEKIPFFNIISCLILWR